MAEKTVINQQLNNATVINESLRTPSNATVINEELAATEIPVATTLNQKYQIINKLNVVSGEADLYVCKYNNTQYIAKVYRRERSIKKEVLDTIKSIDSPDFERYYPEILEDIFEKLEEKWKEKEQREKKIQKNAEWNGVLK